MKCEGWTSLKTWLGSLGSSAFRGYFLVLCTENESQCQILFKYDVLCLAVANGNEYRWLNLLQRLCAIASEERSKVMLCLCPSSDSEPQTGRHFLNALSCHQMYSQFQKLDQSFTTRSLPYTATVLLKCDFKAVRFWSFNRFTCCYIYIMLPSVFVKATSRVHIRISICKS